MVYPLHFQPGRSYLGLVQIPRRLPWGCFSPRAAQVTFPGALMSPQSHWLLTASEPGAEARDQALGTTCTPKASSARHQLGKGPSQPFRYTALRDSVPAGDVELAEQLDEDEPGRAPAPRAPSRAWPGSAQTPGSLCSAFPAHPP